MITCLIVVNIRGVVVLSLVFALVLRVGGIHEVWELEIIVLLLTARLCNELDPSRVGCASTGNARNRSFPIVVRMLCRKSPREPASLPLTSAATLLGLICNFDEPRFKLNSDRKTIPAAAAGRACSSDSEL